MFPIEGSECNGDVTPTTKRRRRSSVGYNVRVVWHKFHILSRAQVFIVASVCAIVFALAVSLSSIPADGTSWNRFLGPSRQLDPFINFGAVFVSILPLFIGYYHLARLGALLGVAASAVTFFATQICGGSSSRSKWSVARWWCKRLHTGECGCCSACSCCGYTSRHPIPT